MYLKDPTFMFFMGLYAGLIIALVTVLSAMWVTNKVDKMKAKKKRKLMKEQANKKVNSRAAV